MPLLGLSCTNSKAAISCESNSLCVELYQLLEGDCVGVSIFQVKLAGVGSLFPAVSIATTAKLYGPLLGC